MIDANLTMGNLVAIVDEQSKAYNAETSVVMSDVGSAPRRRGSLVEEDSTQRVVD